MANRGIQQKIRKMKKRGRYARFSGTTTKYATRLESHVLVKDEDISGRNVSEVKFVDVYIGLKSFSNQVVNGTKRSVNSERMQSYYDHVKPASWLEKTPEDLGIKDPRYAQLWRETPVQNKMNIATTAYGRMDMFIADGKVFFVDLDYKNKIIKRSKDYASVSDAKRSLDVRMVIWESQTPLETATNP